MRALGVSIVALALAAPLIGEPQQGDLVTINVRDEELSSLLEGLSVQHRLNLVAGEGVEGRVTINLYDVPMEEALAQILATQGLAFVQEGSFYRVVTLEELALIHQAQDAIESKVFTLSHVSGEDAQLLLAPMLTQEGRIAISGAQTTQASGVGGALEQGGTGQPTVAIVTDRRSSLARVAAALEELDRPPQQVLLEATILAVDLGEENVFGIDFNVLGGIDFNSVGAFSDLTGISGYDVSGETLDDLLFSGQTFGFTSDPPNGGLAVTVARGSRP